MPLGMYIVSNIFSLILMETVLSVDIIMDVLNTDVLNISSPNSVCFNLPFSSEKKMLIFSNFHAKSPLTGVKKRKQKLKARTLDKMIYLISHYLISKY